MYVVPMTSGIHGITVKETFRSFGLTAVFNTLIAVILTFMVLEDVVFLDVFIIAQLIGLSICFFVMIGMHAGESVGRKVLLAGAAGGLGAGILLGSVLSWLYMSARHGTSFSMFFSSIWHQTAVFGVICGIPIIYFFSSLSRIKASNKAFQDEKIRRLTLEKETARMSLKLLQAQIEPHFLFNTLSTVRTLLDSDLEKGKAMLEDLNAFLRISLQRTRTSMITLDQELDLVRHYLNIYQVRMGPRLTFAIMDHTGDMEIPFPPMILQPLVENALLHGLEPEIHGGDITLECRAQNDRLVITITDTGMGLDNNDIRGGVGIDNVNQRLRAVYGDAARLELYPNRPGGTRAMIKVPL